VDGEFVADADDAPLAGVVAADIQAMEILCMNPRDSTFTPATGVPVVSIWTKRGPVAEMKPALAAILDAQDMYAKQNSEYAESLDVLSLPPYPSKFDISLDVRTDHWRATITMNGYLGTCYVYDGASAASSAEAMPRTPACVYDRAIPVEASGAGRSDQMQ
jgi:hypothetical protein